MKKSNHFDLKKLKVGIKLYILEQSEILTINEVYNEKLIF